MMQTYTGASTNSSMFETGAAADTTHAYLLTLWQEQLTQTAVTRGGENIRNFASQ